MISKVCTKCGNEKRLEDFPKDLRSAVRLSAQCRACHAIRSAKSYQVNRSKVKAKSREWQKNHPDRVAEYRQRRRPKITAEEWDRRRLERTHRRQAEAAARSESREIARLTSKKITVRLAPVVRCPLVRVSGLKQCTTCWCVKSLADFPINGRRTDGRDSNCKACKAIQVKRWTQQNADRLAARARERYKSRPDVREKSHARSKLAKYKRKATLKTAVANFTAEQWRLIKAAYNHRCAYCGERKPLTQDHVLPISKGGQHTASNIVPACRSCNSSKGARPPVAGYQPHLIA